MFDSRDDNIQQLTTAIAQHKAVARAVTREKERLAALEIQMVGSQDTYRKEIKGKKEEFLMLKTELNALKGTAGEAERRERELIKEDKNSKLNYQFVAGQKSIEDSKFDRLIKQHKELNALHLQATDQLTNTQSDIAIIKGNILSIQKGIRQIESKTAQLQLDIVAKNAALITARIQKQYKNGQYSELYKQYKQKQGTQKEQQGFERGMLEEQYCIKKQVELLGQVYGYNHGQYTFYKDKALSEVEQHRVTAKQMEQLRDRHSMLESNITPLTSQQQSEQTLLTKQTLKKQQLQITRESVVNRRLAIGKLCKELNERLVGWREGSRRVLGLMEKGCLIDRFQSEMKRFGL